MQNDITQIKIYHQVMKNCVSLTLLFYSHRNILDGEPIGWSKIILEILS